MQDAVAGLEPETVWKNFSDLSDIPRKSGQEQAVRDHIRKLAEANELESELDDFGNLLVKVPASPGYEAAPVVAIQGHLDMVCQANSDSSHDFEKDPIQLIRDGEWLKADGTTLGADNGIGVAFAMALMADRDVAHPALELVFTLEEETGLDGAKALGFELKAEHLLNLDSEEDGLIYVGCAGGRDTDGTLPVSREATPDGLGHARIEVRGLRGGHSGCDIHLQRGNAVRLLSRTLLQLREDFGLRLAGLDGGNAHNAIPREAFALVALPAGKLADLKARLESELTVAFAHELRSSDPGVKLTAVEAEAPGEGVLTRESEDRLLALLMAMPHGVRAFSLEVEGLVETSSNLAIVQTDSDQVRLKTSQRSSSKTGMSDMCESVDACLRLAGAEIRHGNGYPGWEPDLDSKILGIVRRAMHDVVGSEPGIKAIHAGLECGIIGEHYPELEMVSFGPTIENAHSPDERLRIESVPLLWEVLREVLKRIR